MLLKFFRLNSLSSFIILCFLVSIFLQGCGDKEIDQQEALSIAQNFVDEHVKFYVKEGEDDSNIVQRASITVIDIYKKDHEWNVELHVQSKVPEEDGKKGLIVVIDAKTGEVKEEKLHSFDIE